jgi:putative 4-mercaptohistidine N1-methyltranferase
MNQIYEDQKVLSEYLLFHYGSEEEILPSSVEWPLGMRAALDFAVRTTMHFTVPHAARGLDLGCAVGRSSFEMSRSCEQVLGIDYSHSFIDAANALRERHSLRYSRLDEAHLASVLTAKLPIGILPEHVRFQQGDAMHLPADIGSFDRVHAANLICRLPEPLLLLERLPELVNAGGELILATPCTWLEEFTTKDKWPSGGTLEWIEKILSPYFELTLCIEEPFLIRETARKFQWTSSMLTRWCRRKG